MWLRPYTVTLHKAPTVQNNKKGKPKRAVKTRDSKREIQNVRFEIRNVGFEIRNAGFGQLSPKP